eukprot:403347340
MQQKQQLEMEQKMLFKHQQELQVKLENVEDRQLIDLHKIQENTKNNQVLIKQISFGKSLNHKEEKPVIETGDHKQRSRSRKLTANESEKRKTVKEKPDKNSKHHQKTNVNTQKYQDSKESTNFNQESQSPKQQAQTVIQNINNNQVTNVTNNNTFTNAPQTFNNIYINNQQIVVNQGQDFQQQQNQKNDQQQYQQQQQIQTAQLLAQVFDPLKRADQLPAFAFPMKSTESFRGFGGFKQQSSFTLNDLILRRTHEQQAAAAGFLTTQLSSASIGFGLDQKLLLPQSKPGNSQLNQQQANQQTSFGSQVASLFQPFKGIGAMNQSAQLSFQNSINKPQAQQGLPSFALPEFTDRGSFPTFFMQKSGSIEKSRNSSFVQYSKAMNKNNQINKNGNNSNQGMGNLINQRDKSNVNDQQK